MKMVRQSFSGLSGGFYTIAEAAELLRIESRTKVRNWAFGQRRMSPVIHRQYEESTSEIGFLDLLEVRFINFFRNQGVSLQSLRRAAKNARQELNVSHPFATSLKFVSKRKRIFMLTAKQENDHQLLELTAGAGQYALYDILEKHLAGGIEFDAGSELARKWRPEPVKYPDVVVNPFKARGHPVVEPSGVPTRAIYRLFRHEESDLISVADWFEIQIEHAEQAVGFEIDIARAA